MTLKKYVYITKEGAVYLMLMHIMVLEAIKQAIFHSLWTVGHISLIMLKRIGLTLTVLCVRT